MSEFDDFGRAKGERGGWSDIAREISEALNGLNQTRSGRDYRDVADRFGEAPRAAGPPPWVQDLVRNFGGPSMTPPKRGPRVRRGDVRTAILSVLVEAAMNGYQIIQEIADRTGGAWKPSPGSVYPTLSQLEDEGMISSILTDGRKALSLTEAGRDWVAEHPDEVESAWRPFNDDEPTAWSAVTDEPTAGQRREETKSSQADLKAAIGQTMAAVWHIVSSGSPEQKRRAAEVLSQTRRSLYGLLADGDDGSTSDQDGVA